MKRIASLLLLLAIPAAPASASVMALDMTVNGGTTPVTVAPGDTITVRIYGTVTDNVSLGVNMGVASYAADILTSGGYLQPQRASDGFGGFTNQWDATFDPRFGIPAAGNATNAGHLDDVMGNGATVGIINTGNRDIGALTPTLLAIGHFTAVNPGSTTIDFSNTDGALVVTYDGTYHSVAPTSFSASSGIEVTVVPEPASLGILALGALGLLRRSNRGRRFA